MPIISLAGLAFGGVGGFIGNALTTASNVVNVINNPLSIIPGFETVKNFALDKINFIGNKVN